MTTAVKDVSFPRQVRVDGRLYAYDGLEAGGGHHRKAVYRAAGKAKKGKQTISLSLAVAQQKCAQ